MVFVILLRLGEMIVAGFGKTSRTFFDANGLFPDIIRRGLGEEQQLVWG